MHVIVGKHYGSSSLSLGIIQILNKMIINSWGFVAYFLGFPGDIGAGGLVAKSCPTLATAWSAALKAPLSMGFPRQESWSGLPSPSPPGGDSGKASTCQCRTRKGRGLDPGEDPLEKEMAPYSNTLAWKIPWTDEPDGLQSMGSSSHIRLSPHRVNLLNSSRWF